MSAMLRIMGILFYHDIFMVLALNTLRIWSFCSAW